MHAWSQFMFSSLNRFIIIDSHVVCGLPFGLAVGSSSYFSDILAGQSLGNLIICPNQLSCLFRTVLFHNVIYEK